MTASLRSRLQSVFILSASLILAVTGGAKIVSAFGSARVLAAEEPLTGISYRVFLLTVGAVELGVVGASFSTLPLRVKTALVAMLATSMVLYRAGLVASDWHGHCACLGRVTDLLPLSASTVDTILIATLSYLLVGSYWLLFDPKLRAETVELPRAPAASS